MKIRLEEIGDEPYTWRAEETIPASSLDREEILELTPVEWRGQIDRLDDGFLLRADLAYGETLACQRCLRPVSNRVEETVELLLVQHEPGAEAEERELEEEDLGIVVIDGSEIDLRPILEEQMQLNVPMRPLCKEDCAGLCPVCGADLNDGDCGCRHQTDDPRWAGLAALRDSLPGASEE